MGRIVFAIPGDLSALTGGYGYDRRVIAALRDLGEEVIHCELSARFPWPTDQDVAASVIKMNGLAGDVLLIDGLAFGAMPVAAVAALTPPIVALCHHPLALEAGLTPEQSAVLRASETAALALAAHVVVTSPHTVDTLVADFGVPRDKITPALPGTDPAPRSTGSGDTACRLLAVGSLIPRKGFDVLVAALASLGDLDWHLTIAGSPHRDPTCAQALFGQIEAAGLTERIAFAGEISAEALNSLYAGSDVLVSASHYEGYGMALAEGLARGLPILTSTGGAAADTVPDAAALKVPPGDVGALQTALARLIQDKTLRAGLAQAAWAAGQGLPDWMVTARTIQSVLGAVCA